MGMAMRATIANHRPLVFHEDVFYEYFKPYRHPLSHHDIWGGHGLETYGKDFDLVRTLDPLYVWTVVDADEGSDQWITPGVRRVNRVCYCLTRLPHSDMAIEFRCHHRASSLTPLGMKRQINRLQRAIADCAPEPKRPASPPEAQW